MKRLYFFFVFFFLYQTTVWARPEAAILIQSQRGEMFQVALGGRLINPVPSNQVAVRDLPAGRFIVDLRIVGRGYRSQRIRAEVVLRDGFESVYELVPTRSRRALFLDKVEEMPLYDPEEPLVNRGRESEICRYIMSEEDIDRTIRLMKQEGFDDRRLDIAKGEIKLAGGIQTNDLVLLLKEILFDERRVVLAKFAYPYVCDPRQFSRVFDAFEFESYRREMQDFLYKR